MKVLNSASQYGVYPKNPSPLTEEQIEAREKFMMLWHQELPTKYGLLEHFNHGVLSRFSIQSGSKTLEVGAGLGEHLRYENLTIQEYYCLEYREEFCKELRKKISPDRVICGDIHERQNWPDATFDRILSVHVLEHLRNLPAAVNEVRRLLKPDGVLDIVIPCDGEPLYGLARKVSSERMFRKNFKMDFTPIIRNEHVSTHREILEVLERDFIVQKRIMFPFYFNLPKINLVDGLRLIPKR